MNERLTAAARQNTELLEGFCRKQGEGLVQLAGLVGENFAAGGQLLLAGSGSLQTLAQLLARHFTGRLRFDRPVLPALALGSDPVLMASSADENATPPLVRHYRALASNRHLLLLLTDDRDLPALRQLRDAVLENGQPVAMISTAGERDPLCREGVGPCLDLGTSDPPRALELALFGGQLLCELVEAELFGV